MALTEAQKQLCADWVTSPNRKWQTLNRGQWNYEFHEKTLVRYVEEAKMDEDFVPLLLEYLASDDCVDTLQLYGQDISSKWKPTKAWYETTNKAVNGVRALRLYHALSSEEDKGKDGPYVVEDGCAYDVAYTFYWKVDSVVKLTAANGYASSSGVQYRIANLTRDDETGLFSYVVEKRTRVLQTVDKYTQSVTAFEKREEAQYIGVKSGESKGSNASVSNGVITEKVITKNSDCTHDVRNVIRTEIGVKDAVVEYSKTLHGTRKSVTDKSQASALTESGIKIGERRASSKTPGGLYDNTTVTMTNTDAGDIGRTDTNTIFEERSSTKSNVAAGGKLPAAPTASAAGEGKTYEVSVSLQEDGSADIVESTRTEKAVDSADVEVRRTARGTIRTVSDRNQTTAIATSESDGKDIAIGCSKSSRKTEGGLYNNVTTTYTPEVEKDLAHSAYEDFAKKQVSTTEVVADEDYDSEEERKLPSLEVNKVVSKSARRNEFGSWDISTDTTNFKRLQGVRESRTLLSTTFTDLDDNLVIPNNKNIFDYLEELRGVFSNYTNNSLEISLTPNAHGSYNQQIARTTLTPFSSGEVECWADDENKFIVNSFVNQPTINSIKPNDDTPGRKSIKVDINKYGSYNGIYTILTPNTNNNKGVKIIDQKKDVTYASAMRYGRWEWVSGNMSGYYNRVWEYRRICTMKAHYSGLTEEQADETKELLDGIFTRNVTVSVWNGNAAGGAFEDVSGGIQRLAKICVYHISKNIWGVSLNVNEVTSRLSLLKLESSIESKFSTEQYWSYNLP